MFPMIGTLIAHIMAVINYSFIDELPLEFFYMEILSGVFGGYAVYYMGVYSFGTNVTTSEERARRLARLDGVEVLSNMIGTLLSPILKDKVGFLGTYGFGSLSVVFALLYLVFMVKEPMSLEKESRPSFSELLKVSIVIPVQGLKSIFVKKRIPGLRPLILLQVILFTMYWMMAEAGPLGYNFLRLVFDGFCGEDYAIYMLIYQVASTFYLFIVIPIFVNFKLHDSMILFIILLVEGIGNVFAGFSFTLWQFYVAQCFGAIGLCKYSMVRSLLSKCIAMDELGKVFSVLAITAAFAPAAGSTMFRSLFNSTNEVFVGAFYLLSGLLGLLAALGNLFLFYNKNVLANQEKEDLASKQSFNDDLVNQNSIRSNL